ncbi:MAG: beta-ketoacyl-ACP reductase [Acidimicrobiales bacterium]|jgi:3-oxoacyl-[acyl-carrier protein] reductase|nr:beta-ketoacyl-ACP reductase [Acidimicrobiales bacterium]MDP6298915.1 beta-ketoacyl-ACP reductase [Acidimicrobiales bacterium]HJM27874.1 beta-ketoacyl-ACP reductase [Acidimicrobiales bacterium]HJM98433.1 beta-ketoacyl-ACP reductase [Acidimicrobiales bacterium]
MSEIALVTGANRGIGFSIAQRLHTDGFTVIGTHRTSPAANAEFTSVECDITIPESIESAFTNVEDRFGPVQVLVANAGITKDNLLPRMSEEDFSSVIEANLTSAYRLTKRAIKPMMKKKWGRIILISSVVATVGQAGQANYAASKAGLVGLGRSIAKEFASRNITTNIVAPGPVRTDMIEALSEKQRESILASVPINRFAEPNEIASAVSFLASKDASYITGAIIPVDGGLGIA